MKRPSPSREDDQTHLDKKRKTLPLYRKRHRLAHRQPGADNVAQNPQDAVLIDYQLHKALCVALYSVGFTTVTRQALSSFRDVVQEYMRHFSARVDESMRTCRRSTPTPQDFVHALAQFGLRPSQLEPELDLNSPDSVTQAPILPRPSDEIPYTPVFSTNEFIAPDERAALERQRKPYIPKHFPNYPSRHAYNSTPVYSKREADALRIRERATQEGMQAEQALRKLMAASKAAEAKARELAKQMSGVAHAESEEVWRNALAAVEEEDQRRRQVDEDEIMLGGEGAADARDRESEVEEDTGIGGIVNYDRRFWRRGPRTSRLRAA